MRRIAMVASCLLAVCVASAALAAVASAELPELGRCVAAESTPRPHGHGVIYEGNFTNKNCTHVARTHKGKYEFLPGPGSKPKFIGVADEPEPTLETTSGAKVECSVMSIKGGEYTGPKTATVKTILFSGCTTAEGVPCQDEPLKEGEIEGTEFTMTLGKIEPAPFKKTATAGWDIKKSGEGEAFTYTCGKFPEVRSVQNVGGSVIAPLSSSHEYDVNNMSPIGFMLFRGDEGKQLPESFTGGEKDTLLNKTLTEGLSSTEDQASLTTDLELEGTVKEESVESQENKEPLEIKTKEILPG
jgi:hypothetical protein